MKLFFDTEFTGLHQNTKLISIGIVDESGNKFYAEFNDYSDDDYDSRENLLWCKENVEKHLLFIGNEYVNQKGLVSDGNYLMKSDTAGVRTKLTQWLSRYESIEIWSDCLSYDWVLFCQLFENKLPENVYYIPFDICTLMKIKGVDPDISRKEFSGVTGKQHNSLADAHMIKECYNKLMKIGCDKNDK